MEHDGCVFALSFILIALGLGTPRVIPTYYNEQSMQYFAQSASKYERLGKIIGDILAAAVIVALIIIFTYNFLFR